MTPEIKAEIARAVEYVRSNPKSQRIDVARHLRPDAPTGAYRTLDIAIARGDIRVALIGTHVVLVVP